jgi:hypothetical protein
MERLLAHVAALARQGGELPHNAELARAVGLGTREKVAKLLTLGGAVGAVRLERGAALLITRISAPDGSWSIARTAESAKAAVAAAAQRAGAERAAARAAGRAPGARPDGLRPNSQAAIMLDALRRMAVAGRALPGVTDLADELGLATAYVAADLLRELEVRDLLVLEREGRSIVGAGAADGTWFLRRDARRSSAPPAERRCLRCRDPFAPRHRHNFLCDPCRRSNMGEGDVA